MCGVLSHLAPVHWSARSICCVVCAVSLATWLLFTGVPARCVVLCVLCPWLLGSCSPVWPLSVFRCMCGVCGHLACVHRCQRWLYCVCCAFATWLLFTGVPARCVLLPVRCPWPLGPRLPVCTLALLCVRCPWSLGSCSAVCPLSVLSVRFPWPLTSCSTVCVLSVL